MITTEKCPLCGHAGIKYDPITGFQSFITCRVCGRYGIMLHFIESVQHEPYESKRYLVSGVLRNDFERKKTHYLDEKKFLELVTYANVPQNPIEYINKILLYIHDRINSANDFVQIHPLDFSIFYAKSMEELNYFLNKAIELILLEKEGAANYRLTLRGWQKIIELQKHSPESKNAFVAMSFSRDDEYIYKEGIEPAILSTSFNPVRIDLVEHNNMIDDEIIARIRSSSLLIADFTGQKNGVYFEAGFALGLGIPVIWTCKHDDLDNLHFDTSRLLKNSNIHAKQIPERHA